MTDKALSAIENMTVEELNGAVYEKMAEEQRAFRACLLSLTAEEALDYAYEYTIREDIVMCMEENELSAEQARVMLRSPCPLADVYKDWRKRDSSDHMDGIREAIRNRAGQAVMGESGGTGNEVS